MNKPQDPEAAETVQTTSVPAVDLPRLVRPSVTSEQRKMFRHWSEAIGRLSDADKESEAEAWIASALGILGKTNVKVHTPLPARASDETGVKP